MAESECLADFRFKKTDIPLLAEVLNVPQTIRCDQDTTCDGIEVLCMLLRRMSFPCRYEDMIPRFAKPVPVISMITNTVLEYIYDIHGHRITTWNPEILARISWRYTLHRYQQKAHPCQTVSDLLMVPYGQLLDQARISECCITDIRESTL